ncbi:MAG TPA: hypothetical protein VMH90_04895 [Thermoplasmata archaeon]|nr:hypothetical protein [Thermoplasmata archaeon]
MPPEPPTARRVLEEYLYKEDLQDLCDRYRLPARGNREELVARVLASPEFLARDALGYLDRPALVDLCREWGLDAEGKRDPLIGRALRAIQGRTMEMDRPGAASGSGA